MKAAGWMIAVSVASALTVVAIGGRQTVAEVMLGMLAPLVAVGVSWCSSNAPTGAIRTG